MKKRVILTVSALCLAAALIGGVVLWQLGREVTIGDENIPLGGKPVTISAGDTLVLTVSAPALQDVYGYQFDINYDQGAFRYEKRIYSDIGEIPTIFAKDKEQYLLVGATMTGDTPGFTGEAVNVCRVEFVALTDYKEVPFTLSRVNVVGSDLEYTENIDNWTVSLSKK